MFEAHRWRQNGDHPNDHSEIIYPDRGRIIDGMNDEEIYEKGVKANSADSSPLDVMTASQFDRWCFLHATGGLDYAPFYSEGKVVRRFRNPEMPGEAKCMKCCHTFHMHGWIEPENSPRGSGVDGQTVCPGDMIITRDDGSWSLVYEVMPYAKFHQMYSFCGRYECCYVDRNATILNREHPQREHWAFMRRLGKANLDRKVGDAWSWVARHSPQRLRTAIVIVETVKYSHDHPKAIVPEIAAMDLLEKVR